jgi:hypothetical protein
MSVGPKSTTQVNGRAGGGLSWGDSKLRTDAGKRIKGA